MSRAHIETVLRRLEERQLVARDELVRLRRLYSPASSVGRAADGSGTGSRDSPGVTDLLGALEGLGLSRETLADLQVAKSEDRLGTDQRPSSGPLAPTHPGGRTARRSLEQPWSPPHYEILEMIGSGAVGEVYRARDLRLGRLVAIKAMGADGPFDRERFLLEARHQARVEHPSVCQVYEVGEHAGRPFLAMQLIEGRTLQEIASELSTEQKVELIRQVAEGVHAAHGTGLIHRDLKPANIMVEATDEGLRAYVLDFGIAREEDGPSLTRTGMVVGTPWYMAPEQVAGRGAALDRRTDVYGLGTVLYELFAGRPPFAEESSMAALSRVLLEEAPRLREAMVDAPRDLERIVEQCLRKNPGERYRSARALGEDLARYLAGDPVEASDGGWVGRLGRWVRHHRSLAVVSVLALAASVAFAVTAVRSQLVADRSARLAQKVGREVERVEWLMRAARQLPLHDLTGEKRRLRERLDSFGSELEGLGRRGRLIDQYVRGRGALLLGELDAARPLLEAAWDGGYRGPEVAEALGWTLAEIYDREASLASALATQAEEDRRLDELDEALNRPARRFLKLAVEGRSELANLAAAQLAFYNRDDDEVLLLVSQTEAQSPWIHEATALRGRLLAERAHSSREQVDRERDLELLDRAEVEFRRALEIGRSDWRLYRDLCSLARDRVHLMVADLDEVTGHYREGLEDCANALLISPSDVHTRLERARLHLDYLTHREQSGQDTNEVRLAAEADARWVIERRPDFADSYDVLGVVAYSRAVDRLRTGRDPTEEARMAIEYQRKVLELAPRSAASYQRIAEALWTQGLYVEGAQRIALLREAERASEKMLEIDNVWPNNVASAANNSLQLADALNTNGLDPNPQLDRALRLYREAIQRDPQASWVHSNRSVVHLIRSRHQLRNGVDPRRTLVSARSAVSQAIEKQPRDPFARFNLGESYRQEARWLTLGGVPSSEELGRFWSVIQQGRTAYAEGLEFAEGVGLAWVDLARFDVMAAEVLLELELSPSRLGQHLADGRRALERSMAIDSRRAAAPCEMSLLATLEAESRRSLRPVDPKEELDWLRRCQAAEAGNADYLRSGLRAAWRLANYLDPGPVRRDVLGIGTDLAGQAATLQPDFLEATAYAAAFELLQEPEATQASQVRATLQGAIDVVPRVAPRFASILGDEGG